MCQRSRSGKLCIRNVPDDDVRGPKVTRSLTMRQPAEYLLPAEANDKRSHLHSTVLLLSHQGSLQDGAWRVCDEDGSHFPNVIVSLTQPLG